MTSEKQRVAVIIPAYNEEASIARVIQDVNRLQAPDATFVPIVVNDCSKDTTGQMIRSLPCVALHLPINLGIGGAVQTGIKYAYDQGFDLAIQMDADGQHPSEYVPLLREHLLKNDCDVAIGSRFISGQGYQSTFSRRAGIKFLQWLLQILTGKCVTDPTSGMRMMNRRAMKVCYDYYPDEYPEPEAIILFDRRGLKTGEIPVEMMERQGGVSSIQGWRGAYYMFKVTIAIIFTYLRR